MGFPVLGVTWRPTEGPWSGNLLITGPAYNAALTYKLTPTDQLSLELRNTGWDAWLADRANDDDQLSYTDHRIGISYKRQLGKVQLGIAAGMSYAREITYEENQAFWEDDPTSQSYDIDPTPYLKVGLNAKF